MIHTALSDDAAELRARLQQIEILEERLRLALRAGHIGTYDFDPRTETTTWDDELYAIWGLAPDTSDVFQAAQATIHPEDRLRWEEDVARSLDPGGDGRHNVEMRITRPDTGELRWIHAQGDTTFVNGEPVRLVGAVRDITAEKDALEREQLLAREMNHRVQNIFTVVTGMVRMSASVAPSVDELKDTLTGRLRAMAGAHALIQPHIDGEQIEESDVSVHALASAVLDPYIDGRDRVVLSGPDAMLGPRQASGLALILHEWGTNAAKHGALSHAEGRVGLQWDWFGASKAQDTSVSAGVPVLRLVWTERGGPRIAGAPQQFGFGSRLVRMTARAPSFSAVETDWGEGGVVHTLDVNGARTG